MKAEAKAIEGRFRVPYNTALGWQKIKDTENYRGYLYGQLLMYIELEEAAEEKIKGLFTESELDEIGRAVRADSTRSPQHLLKTAKTIEYAIIEHFRDDLENFKKIGEKLNRISLLERVVLMRYIE